MRGSGCASIVVAGLILSAGMGCASTADVTGDDVVALLDELRFADGLAAARALLARVEVSHGERSLESAEAHQLIAEAMAEGHLGELSERVEHAERAVAIKRHHLEDVDPALAAAVYIVGFVIFVLAPAMARAAPNLQFLIGAKVIR